MAAGDKNGDQPYHWKVAVVWFHCNCGQDKHFSLVFLFFFPLFIIFFFYWRVGIYFWADFLLQASPFNSKQKLKVRQKEMNIENA